MAKKKKLELAGVYEVKPPQGNRTLNFTQPAQDLPESKKDEEWYTKNAWYVASQYNAYYTATGNPNGRTNQNRGTHTGAIGSDFNRPYHYGEYSGMAEEMIEMMTYYLGEQPNNAFNYTVENVNQNNQQAIYIKGQDIAEVINHMKGMMELRLSSAKFSAKALSEDAQNAWNDTYDKVMLKHDLAPIFEQLSQQGIDFMPMNGMEIPAKENIPRWFEENFKEFGAEKATKIAEAQWFSDYWVDKMKMAWTYAVTCGVAAVEHSVSNGRHTIDIFPSYQAIIDRRNDDDFNKKAQFWGRVWTMTPTQIFKRFPQLNKEEREEIQNIADNPRLAEPLNVPWRNITWWGYSPGDTQVGVATVYWLGMRDTHKKKKTDQYGNEKIVELSPDKPGDYKIPDIYKATVIGNKYILNMGLVDNIVEEFTNKSNPLSPIQYYIPDMMLGRNRSIVSRLHVLQDEKDALMFKVREMIGKSKGKVYVIHGHKLGGTIDAEELFNDFASMGVHVTRSSGEPGQYMDDDGRVVEAVDMTLDPNITTIIELTKMLKENMQEISSVSKIALGQQQVFVGRQTQANSIARSTLGLLSMFNGFMNWIQQQMQYSVNVCKLLYTQKDSFMAPLVIGRRGIEYVKFTKAFRFEDFLIFMEINNILDEEGKEKLMNLALAAAQNGHLDFVDIINIFKLNTYDEMENEFEARMKIKKKEAQEAQQAQFEQQMAIEQAKGQPKLQQTQMQQEGETERAVIKAQNELQKGVQKQEVEAAKMVSAQ